MRCTHVNATWHNNHQEKPDAVLPGVVIGNKPSDMIPMSHAVRKQDLTTSKTTNLVATPTHSPTAAPTSTSAFKASGVTTGGAAGDPGSIHALDDNGSIHASQLTGQQANTIRGGAVMGGGRRLLQGALLQGPYMECLYLCQRLQPSQYTSSVQRADELP